MKTKKLKTAILVCFGTVVLNACTGKKADTPEAEILSDGMFEMIYVEGGTFMMGATAEQGSDAEDAEKPAHQVTVSSFRIGKYEVTQKQWWDVMGSWPSEAPSSTYGEGDDYPMYNLGHDDIQQFLTALNTKTGKNYRLPTEAEWEYAARGGNKSKGYKYSGSNTIGDVAWYPDNSGRKIQTVGTKAPNELGIYDMSGNVCEWCSDWYDRYSSSSQTNPTGATTDSTSRVVRGGSIHNGGMEDRDDIRVSCRISVYFRLNTFNLGFRLVLPIEEQR